jgi:hypothetical protein
MTLPQLGQSGLLGAYSSERSWRMNKSNIVSASEVLERSSTQLRVSGCVLDVGIPLKS